MKCRSCKRRLVSSAHSSRCAPCEAKHKAQLAAFRDAIPKPPAYHLLEHAPGPDRLARPASLPGDAGMSLERTPLKRRTPLAAGYALSAGYDYTAFREGIRAHDGLGCWLRDLLAERQGEHPFDYSPGLLTCAGELDGHHLLRKNRLKQELPAESIAEALRDPRNGILVCRRHHEMLERGLVVLRRDELPARATDFAEDWNLAGWLDRYYPPMRRAA